MPASSVRTFSDPDEYAAAVRATTSEFTVVGRGTFDASIVKIDLHSLWMQRFHEHLPRIMHVATGPERAIISFQSQPGPIMICGGAEAGFGTLTRMPVGDNYFRRTTGATSYGSVSLPVEDAKSSASTIAGCELMPPRQRMLTAPPAAAMAKLQRLHTMAGQLASQTPEIIENTEAARGLEQALIQAVVACLGAADVGTEEAAKRRHSTIMRRFHAAIQEHPDEAIYIPAICRATNVAQRTLNVCCHETLGMSPKRYLLLRRMYLARQALRRSGPANATVTGVATTLGFFDLGRFAVQYRALFGETPSATLRASRGNDGRHPN
jgi:AraC-like DNA-binding protein